MPSGTASNIENVSSEKKLVMHVENSAHGLSPGDEEFLANFSDEEKKRVLRKAVGLFGHVDIHLGRDYALHRLCPELRQLTCHSVSARPIRVCFLPGAVLVISKWYLPGETQTRIAILYTSAASGGAFSGLLAFAIAKMGGLVGYEGWRWIFIIEGLATIVLAILSVFLLLDSPSLSSSRLTPSEIRFLELRQLANSVRSPHNRKSVNWSAISSVLTDWKIYLLILGSWTNAVPNYAMKFTMPQIIAGMGFTSARAQLLTIPPYALGAFSAFAFSIFADRYTWRMPFIVVPQLAQVVAFSILYTHAAKIEENIPLCYFGVCLACFGYHPSILLLQANILTISAGSMYPILPGVNAWNVSNTPHLAKRAVAIGYLIFMGNVGGLIGSFIYKQDETPRYVTGYGNSFAFAAAGIIACLVLEFALFRLNRSRERFSEDEVREQYTDSELEEMGDRSPLRYTLEAN
ncbi:major facilitator superfamily domain-containing protein [Aspergillus spinulosporus]